MRVGGQPLSSRPCPLLSSHRRQRSPLIGGGKQGDLLNIRYLHIQQRLVKERQWRLSSQHRVSYHTTGTPKSEKKHAIACANRKHCIVLRKPQHETYPLPQIPSAHLHVHKKQYLERSWGYCLRLWPSNALVMYHTNEQYRASGQYARAHS